MSRGRCPGTCDGPPVHSPGCPREGENQPSGNGMAVGGWSNDHVAWANSLGVPTQKKTTELADATETLKVDSQHKNEIVERIHQMRADDELTTEQVHWLLTGGTL